jgi:hypothetical protein
MYARTSHSADDFPSFLISNDDLAPEPDGFFAGEPVCPQSPRRAETVSFATLLVLLATTVLAAFAADGDMRNDWRNRVERTVASLAQSSPEIAPIATKVAQPAPSEPPPSAIAMTEPLPEIAVPTAATERDATDEDANSANAKPAQAYAPPAPSTDPLSRKAEAVGLHPDLSRAVLARLSATDYRNAAYAINKAVTSVADDDEFVWPRTKKAGVAVFNVHFVEGAAHDCRRYVVTVTKDRWSSTALPMQRCGVKVAYRNAGKPKAVE